MQSGHERRCRYPSRSRLKKQIKDKISFIENNNKKPSTKVIKAPIIFTFSSSLKKQVDIKKEGIVKMQRFNHR